MKKMFIFLPKNCLDEIKNATSNQAIWPGCFDGSSCRLLKIDHEARWI